MQTTKVEYSKERHTCTFIQNIVIDYVNELAFGQQVHRENLFNLDDDDDIRCIR